MKHLFKMTGLACLLILFFQSVSAGEPMMSVNFTPVEENPVLAVGEDGAWDAVSIRFPNVVYHEGQFHMFYTSYTDGSTPQAIGYAVSDDGITFTRHANNPIFEGSGAGLDAFGVNAAAVMVEDDGTWVMYYNGNSEAGLPPFGNAILRATAPSPTGLWIRQSEPVIQIGSSRRWDGSFVFPTSIIKTEDGYFLYYSANGTGKGMVGLALSADGVIFTKYDDPATSERPFDESDPVFMTSPNGAWDSDVSWGAAVIKTERGWEMVYTGGATTAGIFQGQLGYAFSDDGIHWTRYAENPLVTIDHYSTLFGSLIVTKNNDYYAYYGLTNTDGTAKTEAHLAIGSVTMRE